MKQIIRISTDNEVSIHHYPTGSVVEENRALKELIGDCDIYEHVMPKRLYTVMGASREHGNCASMLVDEEGLLKEKPLNIIASYLYEFDMHKHPIVGNVLIVGEKWIGDGISFCGISDKDFNIVFPKLKRFAERMNLII